MFTGIVQGKGEIVSIESGNEITTLQIRVPSTEGLQIGASISIDGVCLTATAFTDEIVSFDVIPETLEKTTLGQLEQGHHVNVERSLRYGDEVGGHLLSGHIIGRGLVSKSERVGDGAQYSIIAPPDVRKYIVSKGYVGIDGYRWSTPWVWFTNLAIIIAIWSYVFYKKRKQSIIEERA